MPRCTTKQDPPERVKKLFFRWLLETRCLSLQSVKHLPSLLFAMASVLEYFVKCCERANVSQIELMMLVP
jgi:hypothetical protein